MEAFPLRLEHHATSQALTDALATVLEQQLRQPLARPLGLATGRTMEPVYAALVHRLQRWSVADLADLRQRWCSFNLDEYCGLHRSDPRNYRQFMRRHLGEPLQLPESALQLPDGAAVDPRAAAEVYRLAVERAGGIGLQLLGLGSNGHVGFNEPPCSAAQACHPVMLSSATRLQNADFFGGDPARVPAQAITLGLREILAAEQIHLVVTGPSKADILQRLLALPAPDPALPASWLQGHPNVWLWADHAALPTVERLAQIV